jgi:serine/threonine protein kinase
MSDQFARVKAIVIRAGELSGEARAAYLSGACGQDPGLRAEVEALLAHALDTPSILATGGVGGQVPVELLQELEMGTAGLPGAIGPYTLLAVLGEGGMGTVYRAQQTQPIRRQVALKLIRRGLDTDRIVARFEAERQTLALMDHPHIARVLDAGASADGRPYVVMELVDGSPITRYCDDRQLDTRTRLALFLAVCQTACLCRKSSTSVSPRPFATRATRRQRPWRAM